MFQIFSNAINDDIHSEFYAAIRNGPTVSYSRIRNIVSFDGVNTRKNDKKNLVWFGEMERKLAKLSMTTVPLLTVLPFNYFMCFRLRGMRECERELTGRQPFTDLTQVSRHVRSVPILYIPDFFTM